MDSTQGDGAASSRPFSSSLISKKNIVSDSIPSTKNDAPAPSPAPLSVAPSSAVEPTFEPVPDVDILTQTVAMSMKSLYGIYGIELWYFNEGSGKLENIALSDDIEGGTVEGLLLKRVTQDADEINRKYWNVDKPQESFKKLTDKSNKGYLAPEPVGPGCGLPGALWSEIGKYATNGLNGIGHSNVSHDVHWREVDELADDPDQPYDDRLQHLAKAGFTRAAGLPFNVKNFRGMVIYFANPHGDPDHLNSDVNKQMIHHSSQMIGAAAAFRPAQEASEAYLQEKSHQTWRRVKIKILTIMRFGGSLRAKKNGGPQASSGDDKKNGKRRSTFAKVHELSVRVRKDFKKTAIQAKDDLETKANRWVSKMHGGNAGIPPSFTWTQTLWSFVGVLVTHTILSRLNSFIMMETADTTKLSLVLAPLGALTTLQYNLTPAPASQPRNAIFAQVMALTVANLVSYIPFSAKNAWFRSALAPAIVIPAMAKLGITHPPAGAASIVFSSMKNQWANMGIFLCGVSITIINAVLINNMSDKRQYPTSWPYLSRAKAKVGICKDE
mmetsp:Transcript_14784/g.30283  ORF Transcript_14784/g.30283 Transcript_14784/m.30283 type:complete len:554 (+) Transcript_14784:423-2084(+)|eukprot:CAMPEP_0113401992 /NCGR_PEP_ID=MMETSP0013_2-20120614/17009_1 /TAXON_ID=2843 ORGANISM="Skeletonema costatum, Strain 1716" /NCGR_SAMPLE_ID=MMETSP0013_2 /ASSEMBLY_ACC=CAM_ASM_000158 /LENGTH=553 /DNA_ID=CAMNT_0000287279 /DNA_START=71 /DNA_END=1732 /DNA_ORIENTATION=- /assembly_acc=CAM_ASM_000158